jgi:nitrogen fixation NifU-like protein
MTEVSQQLYQQVILDHNRSPKNFRSIEAATHTSEGYNPLCGDRYKVYLKVDQTGLIEDVSFEGQGCAISKASASMMTEAVKGKTAVEARAMFQGFRNLLKGEAIDPAIGKLKIFSGVWKYPARVKCAGLSWHALSAALDSQSNVSTESES